MSYTDLHVTGMRQEAECGDYKANQASIRSRSLMTVDSAGLEGTVYPCRHGTSPISREAAVRVTRVHSTVCTQQ